MANISSLFWVTEHFVICAVGGYGYSLEFIRLLDTQDYNSLGLLMWVILPECHRAVI